jgi:nucleoside 2-deoxyribosyltransferase
MPYRIFLSHSARDLALVLAVKSQVEAIGVSVYLYEEHSAPGEALTQKLQQAIREHDALLALLTPNSAPRSYVHQEIGFALGKGKPAVALVVPGVLEDVLAMLSEREYIHLDPADPIEGMTRLLRFLHEKALAKQQQEQLVTALALIGLVFLIAYASAQSSGS